MKIDINTVIGSKRQNVDPNRPPKVSINTILNVKISITGWELQESKFNDGNPDKQFVEFDFVMNGMPYRSNTGSQVIIDQLNEIRKAYPQGDVEFDCVIRHIGKFYKIFPIVETPQQGCNS